MQREGISGFNGTRINDNKRANKESMMDITHDTRDIQVPNDSAPDYGSRGPCFESSHDCMALHCAEPFIIILPLPQYDLNNVERDVKHQGPVVQSIISLKSSLVVKMLTGLVSTKSNSQVVLLKKM